MLGCTGCCAEDQSSLAFDAPVAPKADGAVDVGSQPLDQGSAKEADSDFFGKQQSPPPAAEAPAQAPATIAMPGKKAFEVTLTLTKGEYPGMCLDMSEGAYLRVSKVDRRGPVPDYNANAPEDEQIRDGHFIVAVSDANRENIIKDDGRNMMTALFNGGTSILFMRQPQEFTIGPVRKSGNPLGLDLTYQARSMSVVIKEVFDKGALISWNKTASSKVLEVQKNDHILGVNGKSGGARILVQAMNDSETIELKITRPVDM